MQYLDLNALPISNTDDIRFIVALDDNGKVIKALDTGFATATSVQAQLNETNTQVVDNANAISDLQVKTTNNRSEIAINTYDINRLKNSVDRFQQLEPRIESLLTWKITTDEQIAYINRSINNVNQQAELLQRANEHISAIYELQHQFQEQLEALELRVQRLENQ